MEVMSLNYNFPRQHDQHLNIDLGDKNNCSPFRFHVGNKNEIFLRGSVVGKHACTTCVCTICM